MIVGFDRQLARSFPSRDSFKDVGERVVDCFVLFGFGDKMSRRSAKLDRGEFVEEQVDCLFLFEIGDRRVVVDD
jgi:hypothetical protein